MKSLLILLLFTLFFSASGFAQNPFYSYASGEKISCQLSTKKILVKFDERLSFEQQSTLLETEKWLQKLEKEMLLPAPKVAIIPVQANTSAEKVIQLLENLQQKNGILFANPFLVYEDGIEQSFEDGFIVGLKNKKDVSKLKHFAEKWAIHIIQQDEYMPMVYHLTIPSKKTGNPLDLANAFYESGLFAFAEPDFIKLLKKMSTNDPLLKNQWALKNTGQCIVNLNGQCSSIYGNSGADMKVQDAWAISTGSNSIKIAVLDEGVDLNHPDLIGNLLPGYDATGLGSAGAPSGDDAHGTACAGIIAARGNNSKGIAGIAYSSKIIPVRIAYGGAEDKWVTQDSWTANAINWAWQTAKADILSNSWGGGSSSTVVNNAIAGAVNSGRSGKGTPVLFSAGNSNSSVSNPARNSLVIAVGASSMCDQRKRSSDNPAEVNISDGFKTDPLGVSCDKEGSWGSNFGTNLDIAAPGVKIYTTDISGIRGYRSGDYDATFNGTSSACPNAAGVMALILSVNPNLTQTEARRILENTARKAGGYTYRSNVNGQPNGTWSNDLGYGIVNAFEAIKAAKASITTSTTCKTPTLSEIYTNFITNTSATLYCTVTGVNAYDWTYRKVGTSNWIDLPGGTANNITLNNLQPNTTYEFLVAVRCVSTWSDWSEYGRFTTIGSVPANDNPCSAITLVANSSCQITNGSNLNATRTSSPGYPTTCEDEDALSGMRDVWFKVQMPTSERITIRTLEGSLEDAVMTVYYGSCSSLTEISNICEDDNENGNDSYMPVINISGPAGGWLYIRIWGYDGETGTFGICALNYFSSNLNGETNDDNGTQNYSKVFNQIKPQLFQPSLETTDLQFRAYPIPTRDFIMTDFTIASEGPVQLTIQDLTGKTLQSMPLGILGTGTHTERISTEDLLPGVYLVELQQERGRQVTRIIIQ